MDLKVTIKVLAIVFSCILAIMFIGLRSEVDVGPTSSVVIASKGAFEIANFAPRLILNIPDQTWFNDTSKSNAFDLDSYFRDDNGDLITYNVSGNSNINITIDSDTNVVSFSHTNGWTGTEYVIFTAKSQGSNLVDSNNVSLTVRPIPIVTWDTYDGNTTNFLSMNSSELQDIINMTLERTAYGKIVFTESINISNDINFDIYANISYNRIYINTTNLTNFVNKPAILYMYNLTFENPRILKDGAICPSSICTIINYMGWNLTFSVTQFTVYSTEETPEEEEEEVTPSTGGGGAAAPSAVPKKVSDFKLDKDLIKVSIKQGESKREVIKIKNTGNTEISLILTHGLDQFLFVPEDEFTLGVNEEKSIQLVFTASLDEEADVYTGRLFIGDGLKEKVVAIIIEVKERKALFDVEVIIPDEFKKVRAGDRVGFDTIIYNLGTLMPVDVSLYYSLRDMNGNDLVSKHETFAVKEQKLVSKTLDIPSEIEEGYYLIYAKVIYYNQTATSSDVFRVVKEIELPAPVKEKKFYWVLPIALLIIFIVYLIIRREKGGRKTAEKPMPVIKILKTKKLKLPTAAQILEGIKKEEKLKKPKIIEKIKIRPKITKEKLEEQLKILEESFKSGLVSVKAYNRDKKKITDMLGKFKK